MTEGKRLRDSSLLVAAVSIAVSTLVSLMVVGLSSDASAQQAEVDGRRAAYADLLEAGRRCSSEGMTERIRRETFAIGTDLEGLQPDERKMLMEMLSSFGISGDTWLDYLSRCDSEIFGALARVQILDPPDAIYVAADIYATSASTDANIKMVEAGLPGEKSTEEQQAAARERDERFIWAEAEFIVLAQSDDLSTWWNTWRRLSPALMPSFVLIGFGLWALPGAIRRTREDKRARSTSSS
jgi:hypothetical protein